MLEKSLKHYLLVGVELEYDAANPMRAVQSLAGAQGVLSVSAFLNDSLRAHADVVLPMATFPESYGTYVNATGNWQTAKGASMAPGDARPVWKIMRVLADAQELAGFGYESPESITKEAQQQCSSIELNNHTNLDGATYTAHSNEGLLRAGETPIYATDPLVRRSVPLQKSADGKQAFASMSLSELEKAGLADGDMVKIKQDSGQATLAVRADESVPAGCVWIPAGIPETQSLGELFASVEVSKA